MQAATLVLNSQEVTQKIERIAREIYENNFEESEIIIVGIADRGYLLAERISGILENISPLQVTLIRLKLDKDNPLGHPIEMDLTAEGAKGKVILLVDDVLNTGKTLVYGVKHLLDFPLKMLKTVILVNRRHRLYPIRADYMGLTLSTTMQEHISVEFKGQDAAVYLR